MTALAPQPAGPPGDELSLWQSMRQGSQDARERLFAAYLPFARSVAGRFYKRRSGGDIEHQDFVQLACAGLLEAMDRYDPTLGVPFRGFAAHRIKGSLLDGLGKLNEVREQLGFQHRMRQERTRSLTAEAADKLSPGEALEALAELAVGLALGFMLEGTGLYQNEEDAAPEPCAYDSLAWKRLVARLTEELVRLPERDRTIVRLHYLEEVSFDQIATLLGLSKGRISQVHKAALALLRKRISGAGGFRLER